MRGLADDSAAIGRTDFASETGPTKRSRPAHEVVRMLRRVVEQATEWKIPVFVMDLRCGWSI